MGTDPDAPRREAVHGIVPEGDSSCWLGELCPECGAMPEGAGAEDPAVPCWRCGAVRARITQDGDISAEGDGAAGHDIVRDGDPARSGEAARNGEVAGDGETEPGV